MEVNERYELVKAYLSGHMAPAERERFEARLPSDPALVEELDLQRAETAARELLLASEARAFFREWGQERPSEGWLHSRRLLGWLAGIALLVLVLAAVWWRGSGTSEVRQDALPPATVPPEVVPPAPKAEPSVPIAREMPKPPVRPRKQQESHTRLALQYFQEPALTNLRQPAQTGNASAIRQAQLAYAAGNYAQTLDLLAQVDSTRRQSADFLAANALFHLGRYDEAASRFHDLIDQNSRQYRYAAEWGLLLCRLAHSEEELPVFREQLSAILEQPEHPYYEQAKALKQALEQ